MSINARIMVSDHPDIQQDARRRCRRLCEAGGLIPRVTPCGAANELRYDARTDASLDAAAQQLKAERYFIVTVVANDERANSHTAQTCIYYVFSHPDLDLFLSVRVSLSSDTSTYWSIRHHFESVAPFEEEIRDLFGLKATNRTIRAGTRLHPGCYPKDGFFPLRREQTLAQLRQRALNHYTQHSDELQAGQRLSRYDLPAAPVPDGETLIPVGPIHASVIEPGHFLFHIGLQGERIRQMEMRLGYTHRGIERLFQEYEIDDPRAVQLAEMVSNDSAFAHSYSFCRAVEKLTDTHVPTLAEHIRACLLELERLANHVGDVGALAHDTGREMLSTDLGMMRERTMELCREITGNRLLMGINVPGGVILPGPVEPGYVLSEVTTIAREFDDCVSALDSWGFRRRTVNIGMLMRDSAEQFGVTGIAARSSGHACDFRLLHPELVPNYALATQRATEQSTAETSVRAETWIGEGWARLQGWLREHGFIHGNEYAGDVYSRFCDRVRQVHIAVSVIRELLDAWPGKFSNDEASHRAALRTLRPEAAYQPFLGYSEGWRASIVYWLMADHTGHIYRCKVCDGSMLAWPALAEAVHGNRLSDFPLINKSFNLSYSANDL